MLPTPVFLGFPGGSAGKESAWNAGDLGLIPVLGRSPRERNNYHSSSEEPSELSWTTQDKPSGLEVLVGACQTPETTTWVASHTQSHPT